MEREIGSLEAGKKADLILVDLTGIAHAADQPASRTAWSTALTASDVDTVICDGQGRHGRPAILTLDEESWVGEAVRYATMRFTETGIDLPTYFSLSMKDGSESMKVARLQGPLGDASRRDAHARDRPAGKCWSRSRTAACAAPTWMPTSASSPAAGRSPIRSAWVTSWRARWSKSGSGRADCQARRSRWWPTDG